MKRSFAIGLVLAAGWSVFGGQPDIWPPPAVVRLCGSTDRSNGVWVRQKQLPDTIAMLEQQGCFRRDIQSYYLDNEWVFVFGTRLLVGER